MTHLKNYFLFHDHDIKCCTHRAQHYSHLKPCVQTLWGIEWQVFVSWRQDCDTCFIYQHLSREQGFYCNIVWWIATQVGQNQQPAQPGQGHNGTFWGGTDHCGVKANNSSLQVAVSIGDVIVITFPWGPIKVCVPSVTWRKSYHSIIIV